MGRVRRWVLGVAAAGLLAGAAHELRWALTVQPSSDRTHVRAARLLAGSGRGEARDQWDEFESACDMFGRVRSTVMLKYGEGRPDSAPSGWPQAAPWPVPLTVVKAGTADSASRDLAKNLVADLCDPMVGSMLDGIAEPPRCVRPLDGEVARLIDVRFPELTTGREMGLALVAKMHLAAEPGGVEDLARWYRRSIKVANIQSQQPTLIDRLVSDAVFDEATEAARLIASRDDLSSATLDAMIASTRAMADIPLPTRAMECERLSVLDTLRSLHDENGRCIPTRVDALTRMSQGEAAAEPSEWMNLLWWRYPSLDLTVARAEEHFKVIAEATASEPHARLAEPARLEMALETQAKPADRVLRLLLPALSHFIARTDRSTCMRRATLVLLEVERYRAEHGRPPSSLDELGVSRPKDPYSGLDFGYFIPRPSADPRPYLLYTVGIDGVDNEGAEASDREQAFRSGRGVTGIDFVFNAKPARSK
ncbi:MAG: hypothetical protein IT433_08340 [Phycisphaerales bacterium]|nr:hypothetical protein [Phycisphaerales bacterium]